MNKTTFSEIQIDRIIEMAWEDRTPFEAIRFQFGISEQQVIEIMRNDMPNYVSMVSTDSNANCNDKLHTIKSPSDNFVTHFFDSTAILMN
jgi:hypothetical protein